VADHAQGKFLGLTVIVALQLAIDELQDDDALVAVIVGVGSRALVRRLSILLAAMDER
jgi:hypothetical protein